MNTPFNAYIGHLSSWMNRWLAPSGARSGAAGLESEFNRLALELFNLQCVHNPVYRDLCRARGVSPGSLDSWRDLPAVPAAAFKELPVTCLAANEVTTTFCSSGTTSQSPSRHFHSPFSLMAYEASFLPWFRRQALENWNNSTESIISDASKPLQWISLIPARAAAPSSSLAYMISTLLERFGGESSSTCGSIGGGGEWEVDARRLIDALDQAMVSDRPVMILGTAFNLVHLFDRLTEAGRRFQLPAGSRVMETGGYKGRSRTLIPAELADGIRSLLGIPFDGILTEYGMSELSSQAYARWPHPAGPGELAFPGWARPLVISPETGVEAAEGETGLLRIVDLANVASVLCLQTEDLVVRRKSGFQLLGRRPAAEARGCSLTSA